MHFHSNGKLMISGEYLVLAGARSLAVPLRMGQSMEITCVQNDHPEIQWGTTVQGRDMLRIVFRGEQLDITSFAPTAAQESVSAGADGKRDIRVSNDPDNPRQTGPHDRQVIRSAEFIQKTLRAARMLNPRFLSGNFLWHANSSVDFDLSWGLGSSSSLISNIAHWAGIDPFALFFLISKGSGYDIACARSSIPLLYTFRGKNIPPLIEPVQFFPPFSGQLVFVYSGKKQDSAESIRLFDADRVPEKHVTQIGEISEQMATGEDLLDFMRLMQEHETITGNILGLDPVQKTKFNDFDGTVKSLGAWGGDFLLAASQMRREHTMTYFSDKGYSPVFPYEALCYTANQAGNDEQHNGTE